MTEAVEKTSGGVVENDEKFTYDVEGRLIGVNVNGTQQRWTVFDGSNPYMDFNGAGTAVTERYVTNPLSYGHVLCPRVGDGDGELVCDGHARFGAADRGHERLRRWMPSCTILGAA